MKINKRLLPVKAHFFFFMAASGPILPYLTVYGKQLGISEVLMGTITAVVPITFLLAKPAFGFIADFFYDRRKLIFMALIASLAAFYLGCILLGIQTPSGLCYRLEGDFCNDTDILNECIEHCYLQNSDGSHLFRSFEFYGFIFLMTLSMIAFNVSNSISDAICFDVLGEEGGNKYGYQRVWGTVGFGVTALLGGIGMDFWSGEDAHVKNYVPAFVLVFFFTCIDLIFCLKLRLPKMTASQHILKDLSRVLKSKFISVFLIFATLVGILDGFIIYFMFWFLEDLAKDTNEMKHIKMLEGLTVAAETLGGEILFFILSGKIIKKLGHGHTLTLCFFNYSLRLGLISLITSPWWILAVEALMQGPTYALCYTTIVGYANAISPPGASATMQGIVAGMDDGFGYALGSLAGGLLYRSVGGRLAFQIFSFVAIICCIAHMILYRLFLSKSYDKHGSSDYKAPGEALQMTHQQTDSKTYGINSSET